ncbi:MAG: hypothetical protein JWM44_4351 [Bacilli bacterium]|nr:hypothetical protein [Bacilli bacterium]
MSFNDSSYTNLATIGMMLKIKVVCEECDNSKYLFEKYV